MISIQDAKFGKGLFALVDIPKNTVITSVTGPHMNFLDTIGLKERESHTIQVGIDQYILCDPPFLYSNHSCEPNCGVTPELELITLQPIRKGEELLWDYSTSMLERHWTMNCRCGSAEVYPTIEALKLEKSGVLTLFFLQLKGWFFRCS